MTDYFVSPGKPPSSVPGPYREPAAPAPYKRPVSQPAWRVVTVPQDSTLQELALRFYQNPMEAITRIFRDNQGGKLMPDGSLGAIDSPNDIIPQGTPIWLS